MHAPCSDYRSILSFGSYYLEDFDYRSILVDSGIIVHWSSFFAKSTVVNVSKTLNEIKLKAVV